MNAMLKLKKVLNLLTTAISVPLSNLPDPPLINKGIGFPFLPFPLLRLMVHFQKLIKTMLSDAFYPEVYSLSVLAYPSSNPGLRHSLFIEPPTDGY